MQKYFKLDIYFKEWVY